MSTQDDNKAVVERFVREFYRNGNLDVFDDILAPDFFFAGVGGQIQGDVQALKDFASKTHAMIHTAAPDLDFSIDEMIAEGECVAVRLTERGTFTGPYVAGPTQINPTGKPFEITAMEFFRVRDGKICERWATRDRLGFLQQIDAPVRIG